MKKTVLKLISVSLCLIFALGIFAACGNKNEGTFVIGCTGPLTGDAASYGKSVQKGAQLAVDEINAKGGIQFTFEMEDDQADATKVTTAYSNLLAKGMVVSIGSVTSGSCITFAEESAKDNLFFITPSASADDAIKNSNGYRICFGDPDQGMYAARELAETYVEGEGNYEIGIIYNSDDAYSIGLLNGFKDEMVELNKQSSYVAESFTNETNTNFQSQVKALKDAGCKVIFLPIYYKEASLIIKEVAKDTEWDVDFFGCDGMDGIIKYNEGSEVYEKLNGLKYLTPFDAEGTGDKEKAFVEAYKAKYDGETPDQFAADAYDAVYVIYEAMTKAEITDTSIDASELCDAITAILQGDFTYEGVTGTMTWNENGAATKAPKIVTIKVEESK